MKQVIKIETFDGLLHNSTREARKHLDSLLGNFVTRHSHKLVHLTKYVDIGEYLLAELDSFNEAIRIKQDLETFETIDN